MNLVGKISLPRITGVWRLLKDFAGLGGEATYLWPRWLVLRAVGLVYIVIFAGIIAESSALIGPQGVMPLADTLAQLRTEYPNLWEAVRHTPTLFWLNQGPAMIAALEWTGLVAAVGLVLNFWPRLMLFVCWLCLLSFARGWVVFSDPQVDWLMLEVALLAIPFAPAGWRPGLGAHSSPRPLVLFMLRWLLFRVMFESGLAKFMSGEPRWRDFTAMDVLYETAPCPTILGYLDHQLPHWWHLVETALTFAAELLAPLLAVFAGRRGRWTAFWLWSALQVGIQLTCNFGWLNTASFALGFLLLDDQMLAAAARRLRLRRLADGIVATATGAVVPAWSAWRRHALGAALWVHFYLSLVAFLDVADLTPAVAGRLAQPFRYVTDGLGCINTYKLYSRLDPVHAVAEFLGSNDGGRTWRPYEFRYYPQAVDRICPFIAPWFPRFEATLQIQLATRLEPTPLYASVARQLLARNPETLRLFAHDPFPDAPPQLIRVPAYQYTFTNLATLRAEGRYWHRTYLGEFLPLIYLNTDGAAAEAVSPYEQVRVKAALGNPEAQSHLGFLFIRGEEGVDRDPAAAVEWFERAAAQGVAEAQFNLALILARGDGVPPDAARAFAWCRLAAEQGHAAAQDRLAIMYFDGEGVPRNETEGLAWFEVAARSGHAEADGHWRYARHRVSPATALAAGQRAQALRELMASREPPPGGKP